MRCRAATTAPACCRRSIACAISGAYASRVIRDSMIFTPAEATRAAISSDIRPVISSAFSRSESWPPSVESYG